MTLFGVHLIGLTRENLHKLVLTVLFLGGVLLVRGVLVLLTRLASRTRHQERLVFWTRQVSAVIVTVLMLLAVASIWFDDPKRWATPLGMVSAGLAFALQKVITAFAAYVVILRGKTYQVGDRVAVGAVRGDVIALGFFQTRVMEMGEPPPVTSAPPATWVHGRQFTGRVVSFTNDKIFEEPVYNYTRDFPFLWEEIAVPISYESDRAAVEEILLRCAGEETTSVRALSQDERRRMEQRYFLDLAELEPRVFHRLTDNWLELAVRFVARPYDVRALKDRISRRILSELEAKGIGIASATYDVVDFPKLRLDERTIEAIARALGPRRERERMSAS